MKRALYVYVVRTSVYDHSNVVFVHRVIYPIAYISDERALKPEFAQFYVFIITLRQLEGYIFAE